MKWIIAIVLICVAVCGVYFYMPEIFSGESSGESSTGTPTTTVATSTQDISYSSQEFGISFDYPASYTHIESNASKGGREIYYITIGDEESLSNAPQNGEGPPVMTVGIFSTNATSADAWIRSDNLSGFQLSNGSTTVATVDGVTGVEYMSDGLYAMRNIVVLHNGRAYLFLVGWINENDAIVDDFNDVLSSVRFN